VATLLISVSNCIRKEVISKAGRLDRLVLWEGYSGLSSAVLLPQDNCHRSKVEKAVQAAFIEEEVQGTMITTTSPADDSGSASLLKTREGRENPKAGNGVIRALARRS